MLGVSVYDGVKRDVKCVFFFFNDTATTEIYTLSLHDALPISIITILSSQLLLYISCTRMLINNYEERCRNYKLVRSEEHTSELQSPVPISYAVFCLKKKKFQT